MARAGTLAVPGRAAGGGRDGIRFDVIAGLITAAVVIPKALAYASIAGLPVQVGLTTALVPMVIYALLGTSRVLSVSTTTTIAILTAAQLSAVAPDGDPAALVRTAAALALLVGGVLVRGFAPAARLRRRLHLRAGARRLQGGNRARHRVRPAPEAPRRPLSQDRLLPQPRGPLPEHPRDLLADAPGRSRDDRAAPRSRAIPSEGPGAARRRGRGNRRDGSPRTRRAGRRSHREDLRGPAVTRASGPFAGRAALAGSPRHRPHELHRDDRRRAGVRPDRRATAQTQPRAARDGPRQRRRSLLRGHAGGRRDVPDGGQPPRGSAHAGRRARDRGRDPPDDALPRALDRPHAPGDPGGRRHRLLDWPDSAGRVPRDPRRPADGVGLGPDRVRRRRPARDASRDPRRHRGFARRPLPPDGQSAGPGPRAQARHQRLPASHEGAPGGRDLPGPAAAAARRADFLRQRGEDRARRCGRSSPRRIRRSSRST